MSVLIKMLLSALTLAFIDDLHRRETRKYSAICRLDAALLIILFQRFTRRYEIAAMAS